MKSKTARWLLIALLGLGSLGGLALYSLNHLDEGAQQSSSRQESGANLVQRGEYLARVGN